MRPLRRRALPGAEAPVLWRGGLAAARSGGGREQRERGLWGCSGAARGRPVGAGGPLPADGEQDLLALEQLGIEDRDPGYAGVLRRLHPEVAPFLEDRRQDADAPDVLQPEAARLERDRGVLPEIERRVEVDRLHVLHVLQDSAEDALLLQVVHVGSVVVEAVLPEREISGEPRHAGLERRL